MKHKLVLTGFVAALVTHGAHASEGQGEAQKRKVEETRTGEVADLLQRLSEAGALEVDQEGNVQVKPSVLDQLRQDDRVEVQEASIGSICT